MAENMIGEIITEHRERMLNLKKYYPFFRLMDDSFDQYKDGKYCALDMGYILMAVLRFFIEENNFKEKEVTYKEYQERSAFTQKHFRKKNAGAIDAYEEADKYIKEHIKDYYIDGKAPKRSELAALSKPLKDKLKAIMPEHKAYLLKHETAMRYTRQVRQYLNEQYMKSEREKSRQRTQAKHRNKNALE